jgi:hypothetical protein
VGDLAFATEPPLYTYNSLIAMLPEQVHHLGLELAENMACASRFRLKTP